jgi:hypothetical protein
MKGNKRINYKQVREHKHNVSPNALAHFCSIITNTEKTQRKKVV